MDLCGAGHVARVLGRIPLKDAGIQEMYGIGLWHPKDEDFIRNLLVGDGHCDVKRAFLLPRGKGDFEGARFELLNLDLEKGRTTRVVRLYHTTSSGIVQLGRVDWEDSLAHRKRRPTSIDEQLKKLPDDCDAVVIHDLCKGVVDKHLVEKLLVKYPDSTWYVRSKKFQPDWLGLVKRNLKLLLIGPEILNLRNPWHTWQVNRKLTHLAFQLLDEAAISPEASVVLVSDLREIIMLVNQEECLTTKEVEEVDTLSQVGWPSAFFASLINQMRFSKSGPSEAIEFAVSEANKHRGPLADLRPTADLPKYSVRPVRWIEEKEKWKLAEKQLGILEVGVSSRDEKLLEVWRGCKSLPGYVVCIREKCEIVNRIGQRLRNFRNQQTPTRSVSILLQADPGTGKTFLAKTLAEIFDFRFIKWDITQMVDRSDLLDLFDSIATEQANQKKPILIFVDEINARLAGGSVYGAFLAPLEEGSYVRRGNAFNLRPCAWIFAGTGLDESSDARVDKIEDFRARMTFTAEFDFRSLKRMRNDATLIDDARLEQVYLGAFFIRQFFPDVTHVSQAVLETFYHKDPAETPARKIRNSVMMLRNVQYGSITKNNFDLWKDGPEDGSSRIKLVFASDSQPSEDQIHENGWANGHSEPAAANRDC